MIASYLPMFMMFTAATLLASLIFTLATFLGPKANLTPEKIQPYECGSESAGANHVKMSVKFYVTAILFVVFDIEVVFIYPWALVWKGLGPAAFAEMALFLAILAVGLIYAWKKGVLEWN